MSNNPSPHIAFIKARWHADIVDRAYEGFVGAATPAEQTVRFHDKRPARGA